MHQIRGRLARAVVTCLVASGGVAAASPPVDCSKPEFKRPDSARSLLLWTKGAEERIRKAKAQGVHEVKNAENHGGTPIGYCADVISYRGSAYCKEATAEYERPLRSIIAVCNEAARPSSTAGGPVDCKDPRFKSEAPVDQLLRWVEIGLRGLDSMPEREKAQLEPKCDRSSSYAGAAYCKAPTDPRTSAAVARVNKECAAARARFAAKASADASAQAASVAAARANRKVVAFPRPTFRGAGAAGLAAQMKRALLAGGVAKAATELLRVQPMGRWQSGRYVDTKVPYQKIMGTVLWWDDDRDGVCRFTSYKFVKEGAGRGKWSALKFKAFCNGCPEGWTRCK